VTEREQRQFTASLASLPETASFVEAFCARCALPRPAVLRLTFIVEELFTNTVLHGYGADSDACIGVTLAAEGIDVVLLYEDAAPRYDPIARWADAPPSLAGPPESRTVGGLGVYIVSRFVADARYAYEEGINRLWLRIHCNE